ncbi:hypothetical protein ABZ990_11230 [Streptomyces sp. NPDC046203]|uniref:hypothetical protein n=1 Tax=Streptomyces sp. NPDC046203 TaxID=3154602 RepID=UPI00340EC83C
MGEKQRIRSNHGGDPTRPPHPTRRRWWPRWSRRTWTRIAVSALGTVVLGGPVALVGWTMLFWDGPGEPEPTDCAQVMDWAGATLPKSARSARCTEATWLDVHDQADFRMPAAEVAGWVAGTWPAVEVEPQGCDMDADFCVDLDAENSPIAWYDGEGPAAVNVSVRYEDGGTALVLVTAYTI